MKNADLTKLDKKKVIDVAKKYSEKKVENFLSKFEGTNKDWAEKIKKAKEKRTVGEIVGTYGNFRLETALVGSDPDYLVQSWKDYEDHISKYNEVIENYKAEILYDMEVIKNLVSAREKVEKEYKYFKDKKFEINDWPMKGSEDKELDKKCHDVWKSHLVKNHIDSFTPAREYDPNIDSIKPHRVQRKLPAYEMICGSNGKFKYIRCTCCYEKSIKDSSFKYSDMNIYNDIGSS